MVLKTKAKAYMNVKEDEQNEQVAGKNPSWKKVMITTAQDENTQFSIFPLKAQQSKNLQ